MRKITLAIILALTIAFGCATISTTSISKSDVSWLVGTWTGWTSGALGGSGLSGHGKGRSGPNVELKIFNTALRGRITMVYSKGQSETFPFLGKIEGGRLVAHWKGGRWMKLALLKANGKKRLEGKFDFLKVNGTISLNKAK